MEETIFERIIPYIMLEKTETKGTIKICWQCGVHDQSIIGRYKKIGVHVLTTIMTDEADSDVVNDGGHIDVSIAANLPKDL